MDYLELATSYRILQYAAEHENTFYLNDICLALGDNPVTIRRLLERMNEDGLIQITSGANFFCKLLPDGNLVRLQIEQRLNQKREETAAQDAKEAERQRSQHAQAIKDKKQEFRHDFTVAAFSVALTLILEHLGQLIRFFYELFRSLA